ncbi:cysteine hydrolase family protein [Allomuricauda sp. SCSIO 65647]|uniref:cysteine hydrolase family protein n=1 Tax=Allomuricauda sp. SCSIO 65647 TaxID=2908843 RepID=UPI001F3A5C4F|nr:cysteine hydrolase [Muricauda sp. SCSIO 65647]UJH66736.1 cysteine hydrolase [Muricauda sp. SCSIO 65647]
MKSKLFKSALTFFCLSLFFSDLSFGQSSHQKNSNKVLLITSAQVDLLSEEGKAWGYTKDSETRNKVRKNLKKIIKEARKQNIPIIHSPVGFDYELMKGYKPLNAIQGVIVENKLLEMNSPGTEFIAEAFPLENEIVLPYRQGFTSFWANSIQEHLERFEVDTIYIAGMLAEGCVESHARDAAENGYSTIVISDAIGSTSLELLEASEKTLALHTKAMISTKEFVKN